MRLIAHRGNIDGPNQLEENKPEYIENAISGGFDAEIDVWYDTDENNFYLGHDSPQYVVTQNWLELHINKLWIHCKNLENTLDQNLFLRQDLQLVGIFEIQRKWDLFLFGKNVQNLFDSFLRPYNNN